MAIEKVKAFYKELEANEELQKKIAAADAAYNGDTGDKKAAVEAIVLPIAKEAGFDFTAEELLSFNYNVEEGELFEEELQAVAGGIAYCFLFGFGTENSNTTICKYIGIDIGFGH